MTDKRGAPLPEFMRDEPTICFTMEIPDVPEYRQAVVGLVTQLGKWFFWEKSGEPGDTRGKYTAEIFRKAYYETFRWHECMCDCDAQELALWQQGQALDQMANLQRVAAYDGSTTSIDPDAPTTTFDYSGTGEGETALCNAVKHYVEKMLLDTLNKQRIGLGLAAVGAGILGGVAGPLGAVVGGIAVIAAGVTLAMTEAAAADRTAIDNVICDMTAALTGDAVNQTNFGAAIVGMTSSEFNELTIINILEAGATNLWNYLYFIALLGEAKRNAAAGIDNCPCGDNWCYTFDFTTSGLDGWEQMPAANGGGGSLAVGVGIQATDAVDTVSNPDIGARVIYIKRSFASTQLTKIIATYDNTFGTFDQVNLISEGVFINGAAVASRNRNVSANGTNRTLQWTGSSGGANELRFFLRVSRDQTAPYSYSGSGLLKSVRVEGIGPNPFGDDNCEE